ncbi:MAG: hypothetical protein ACTSWN_14935, partial [Promethearchaeota archaeon]
MYLVVITILILFPYFPSPSSHRMGPVHECSNNVRSSSESVILQNNFFQIGGSDSDITVLKIDP